jgi:hypothetical protein
MVISRIIGKKLLNMAKVTKVNLRLLCVGIVMIISIFLINGNDVVHGQLRFFHQK